jgi:hypothetical protein
MTWSEYVQNKPADAAALELMDIFGMRAQRLGVERRRVDIHSVSRPDQKREGNSDNQRDRRHHFEVN